MEMNPLLMQLLQALQQRSPYQLGGNRLNGAPGAYLDPIIQPQQMDQNMQYNPQNYVGHQFWLNKRPQDFKTNT